jgi:hypothetical protein
MLRRWIHCDSRPGREEAKAFSVALHSYWAAIDQFELVGDIVHRRWVGDGVHFDTSLIVVPEALRKTVLQMYHEARGHFGRSKMAIMLRGAYYWYGLTKDIQQWVDSCAVCRRRKSQNTRAPLEQDQVSYVRQLCFLDAKGPLRETAHGNRHYIVCVDGYSKYCVLYPVPDLSAATIWSSFYDNVECQIGAPVTLHTDGYSSLVESTAQELFGYLNVFKTKTSPHHPPSDGQSERFVRSTLDVLTKVMAQQPEHEWDQ